MYIINISVCVCGVDYLGDLNRSKGFLFSFRFLVLFTLMFFLLLHLLMATNKAQTQLKISRLIYLVRTSASIENVPSCFSRFSPFSFSLTAFWICFENLTNNKKIHMNKNTNEENHIGITRVRRYVLVSLPLDTCPYCLSFCRRFP